MDLHQLIKESRKGEQNAQMKLFELYRDRVMAVCMRYSKNEAQANEILTDGFAALFDDPASIPEEPDFESRLNLFMIVRAIGILRKNVREYTIASTARAGGDLSELPGIADEEIIRLLDQNVALKAIQLLSPAFRIVVNMHLIDGYTMKEISAVLEVAEDTLKANFEKGMHQFRKNTSRLVSLSHAQ